MFKKYNSIENTYREEFLEKIKAFGLWEDTFIVQEKVHGANLSFHTTDGENFYTAKRTGLLEADEKFYNHGKLLNELKPKLQNIWSDLQSKLSDVTHLAVFGEVIGGTYPHPEVEKDKKAIRVQKGIFYSPKNHFYAFDILINQHNYLDVEAANEQFEKQNLLYAKTIFEGSIEECLAYPNNFDSLVPKELGLPELKTNVVEGVIIKPLKTSYFRNGTRLILKNKNEKWAENKQFKKTIKKEEALPEKIVKLQEAILTYVTENRLNNVLSKLGEVTKKDFGRVLGMFSKDITDDFFKDYHTITDELDKKELKLVTKSFNKVAIEMINLRLKNS